MVKFFKEIRKFFFGLTKAEKAELEKAKEEWVRKVFGGNPKPKEKARAASPEELKALLARYKEPVNFEPGDLVAWKKGLKNRKFPAYDEPVVVKRISNSVVAQDRDPGMSTFHEDVSLVIGEIDAVGDFEFYHVDPQRFTKYIEPENTGAKE